MENALSVFAVIAIELVLFLVCVVVMYIFFPYKSAKNHWYVIASIVLFLVIIYTLECYKHFTNLATWVAIADNIFSGAIFSVLCLLFLHLERKIRNKEEDKEKLTQDYERLVEKYQKDNLIIAKGKGENYLKYPIICLGQGKVKLSADSDNIFINDSSADYYQLPDVISCNYINIFSVHDTSAIYNNLNIRVKKMILKNDTLTMETQRTTFFDSLVTNRAADYKIVDGLSVRELFEVGPVMNALEVSKLSNHLGFNGVIESADGYIVFIKRSSEMSIAKKTYGNSLGASLKTKYALKNSNTFDREGLTDAICEEISDELKISRENLFMDTLCIVAAYRDCVECGKPQLLVYAKSRLTASCISNHFVEVQKKKRCKKKSLTRREINELRTVEDGRKLIWIKRDSLLKNILFSYKGIKIDSTTDSEGFIFF